MPGIAHEAPLELLRRDPLLLRGLGVAIPADATAAMASADLSASVPAELRADAVVVLSGTGGARLAVIVEVRSTSARTAPGGWSWPGWPGSMRVGSRPTLCLSSMPRPSRPGRRWRP